MRCYFHLQRGGKKLLDDVGTDVASVDEARTEALKAVAELRREDGKLQQNWNGWHIKIVDQAGDVLSVVPLNAIFHPIGGHHVIATSDGDLRTNGTEPE